jgi:hypothetical protein
VTAGRLTRASAILAVVGLVAYSTGRSARAGRTELATTAIPPPPPAVVEAARPVAKAEGRLTEISGEVWVARADGTGQPVVASVGTEVFAGEVLRTTTNASAQFAYADGSTLSIYRGSAVVLSRTDAGPGLDLRRGAVDADIRKQPDGRHLQILGELMHAEIVGTEFRLMVDSSSAWLGVREGKVEVTRVSDGQKILLGQAISNLVANASDSIVDASGTISVSTGVMECQREDFESMYLRENLPPGKYIYVQVADTGCGMAPDLVGRAFDPFFTTKIRGRGMGLSTVIGVARAHDGALRIQTAPDKGSTFTVLFPCSQLAPQRL